MTMIDSEDPRFARALALADASGSWLKLRDQAGHCIAVGIPSSKPGLHYRVTRTTCECEDQQRHPHLTCKHRLALAIALARKAAEPMPASVVIDGLSRILSSRKPIYSTNFRED